jgi:DNA polymerase I-like protein with 3'-5' exonuclease and polymerase domains
MLPIYGLDTETELITDETPLPRLVCVSVAGPDIDRVIHWSEAEPIVRDLLMRAAQREIVLVGHNLCAYDLPVLLRQYPRLNPWIFRALNGGRIADTKLIERMISRALGAIQSAPKGAFTLDTLARSYLGKALDKGADGWRLRYAELRDMAVAQWPERAVTYALEDARVTRALFVEQLTAVERIATSHMPTMPGLLKPLPGECRAAFALSMISARGMVCDRDQWRLLVHTQRAKLAVAKQALQAAGLYRDGSIDMVRVRALVHEELGVAADRTDSGLVKADADALARCSEPALQALTDYKQAEKTLSTFAPIAELGSRRPIHTQYQSIVATARTSSSKPNLQNLPRGKLGIRECFAPRPGCLLCSVDYSGAELRSFAQVCQRLVGYSRMGDAFRADVNADLHLLFGAARAGVRDAAQAKALKAAGDPRIKRERQLAKIANFGFLGGMGPAHFARNENSAYRTSHGKMGSLITKKEAEALRESWYKHWPEARAYHAWSASVPGIDTRSAVVREPISGGYRGGLWYASVANTPFQSLTAWGAKLACWAIVEACYSEDSTSPLRDAAYPVSFIHDELLLEIPTDAAHEMAMEQTRIQIEAFQEAHPDVPVTAEPAIMRRWCKGAEAKYDDHHRLIAWDAETEYAPPMTDPVSEEQQVCLF